MAIKVMNSLKNGRASGPEGIIAELAKLVTTKLVCMF